MLLSKEQFAAVAELISMRGGKAQEAARIVTVEGGVTQIEVARRLGISQPTVSHAVARVERAMALVRIAAKV